MKIREALNKFDREALDEGSKYYDFVNLYESSKPLTNDEQKALNDAIKTKNPDTINATMNQIQLNRNPAVKDKVDNLTASVTEDYEGNEYNQLDKIWEEEELEEGRHDLKVEPTKAIESNKTHYRLRDTKTGELASYKTPYWYPTREGAQDAINDPDRDLGYGKEAKKTESLELDEVFSGYHGFYNPTPQIINKIQEYKNKNSKVNIPAVKDVEKLYTYYKTAYIVDWPQLRHDIISRTNLYLDKEILEKIDAEFNSNIQSKEPKEAPKEEPKTIEEPKVQSSVSSLDDDDFFESLTEDIVNDLNIDFGKAKNIKFGDLSSETQQFIMRPLKKNGEPWDQTKALIRLYDHIYNKGEKFVDREELLKEAGSPSWYREGDKSLWFTEFGILGLASLADNKVLPGPNLKGWMEGTVAPVGERVHWTKPTEQQIKKFGVAPNVTPWYEPIGSGNPEGLDLRYKCNDGTYEERESQGPQHARSHGKGDTKKVANKNNSENGFVKREKEIEKPEQTTVSGKVSLDDDDFFEGYDENHSEVQIKEELESLKINESVIDESKSSLYKKTYRKYAGLDDDIELTEEVIDEFIVKDMCANNGWNVSSVKNHILSR